MSKLFVISDVHSFFTPFKKALDDAGFDENNPDHYLVSCGDLFDRGPESKELLHYIMSLDRKILIKGNHDLLLDSCCMREFPYSNDKTNGTVDTIRQLGGWEANKDFAKCCVNTWNRLAAYRNMLVNYLETKNYIFVHSWLPTRITYDESASKPWFLTSKKHHYTEDWRNANEVEWEDAMWGNPFELAAQGLNQTGKTIVFGHFHTSYAHSRATSTSEFSDDANFDIYYGKDFIGIDACTAYTKKVNVLVLDDIFKE